MTPATAWFDVAPGIRLAADIFGDPAAPTVLMLHGGGQTRHAWHATAMDLADAGWRAVTVGLRGHGESSHPRPSAYALEDFAADARGLISSIAADPIVIGASLGGIAGLPAVTESPRALAAVNELNGQAAAGFFGKMVPLDARIERFRMDGQFAVSIEGLHAFLYKPATDHTFHVGHASLAANAVLVQRGDVMVRLEGRFDKARAVQIARSLER
jgi:pimeloyl-ACP methyl ester carboxylesterase